MIRQNEGVLRRCGFKKASEFHWTIVPGGPVVDSRRVHFRTVRDLIAHVFAQGIDSGKDVVRTAIRKALSI